MGSNQNKYGDKFRPDEWGSKGRKEDSRQKRGSARNFAIEDSTIDGTPTGGNKRRKKDTKRWCRGKEGLEHDYRPFKEWKFLNRAFVVDKCHLCGKERFVRP